MYVWFVLLLCLGSLTAGYFFFIGQQLGSMSWESFMGWLWRSRIDRAERKYAEPFDPEEHFTEVELVLEPEEEVDAVFEGQ